MKKKKILPADNANGLPLALNKTSVITLGVVLLYSQLLDKRLVGLSKEETLCGKRKKDVVSRLRSKVGISIHLNDSSDSDFQS